jgi:hypothetical protein
LKAWKNIVAVFVVAPVTPLVLWVAHCTQSASAPSAPALPHCALLTEHDASYVPLDDAGVRRVELHRAQEILRSATEWRGP